MQLSCELPARLHLESPAISNPFTFSNRAYSDPWLSGLLNKPRAKSDSVHFNVFELRVDYLHSRVGAVIHLRG